MKKLKKLSCSISAENIIGKPFENNIVDIIKELCSDFKEIYSSNYKLYLYYTDTVTATKLKKFKSKFEGYEDFVSVMHISDINLREYWYCILNEKEREKYSPLNNRSFYIIKDVSKQSLIFALLDFYYKASLLTQIKMKGARPHEKC